MNINKNVLIPVGASVASLAAGVGVGWLLAKRKFVKHYEAQIAAEIEAAREVYNRVTKKAQYATPQEAAAALHPDENILTEIPKGKTLGTVIRNYQGINPALDVTGDVAIINGRDPHEVSIFDESNSDLKLPEDFTVEDLEARTEDEPYIITVDEFGDAEPGYGNVTVTFFEGDGVLVDDQETPIRDFDDMIGEKNLEHFGQWSGDRNVVYIRNERLATNFEVLRSKQSYVEGVLKYVDARPDTMRRRGPRDDG